MSDYTLRLIINQKEIDSDSNEYNLESYVITNDFNIRKVETIALPANSAEITVSFGSITTAQAIRVSSSSQLAIKLNGGTQGFSSVYDLIIRGIFTGLSIRNIDTTDATVTVEIWSE